MKLERLFNVLVLGGALPYLGCNDGSGAAPQPTLEGDSGSGVDTGVDANSGPSANNEDAPPDVDGGGDLVVDASELLGLTDAGFSRADAALDCTALGDGPTDGVGMACGCPCCWAPSFPNTDPVACASFCGACCDDQQ